MIPKFGPKQSCVGSEQEACWPLSLLPHGNALLRPAQKVCCRASGAEASLGGAFPPESTQWAQRCACPPWRYADAVWMGLARVAFFSRGTVVPPSPADGPRAWTFAWTFGLDFCPEKIGFSKCDLRSESNPGLGLLLL